MNKESKILVTGCGGMVGEAVYNLFRGVARVLATDIDLNESWLQKLDVSSKPEVRAFCNANKPDYIIHLAALTDMEYCEKNPDHAYAVNAYGTEYLADYAKSRNIPFVYISTAGIFGGEKEFYKEDDIPNPASIYAKSKYEGELTVRSLPKHIVIRAGWMMGGGPKKDKKFVNKIIGQLKNGTKELYVVNDKFGTPTFTYDLAKIIKALLDINANGVFHGVGKGDGNRADIARFIVNFFGLSDKVIVREVDSESLSKHLKGFEFFAPRPRSERLVNTKLQALNADFTRDWRECLKEYLPKFEVKS